MSSDLALPEGVARKQIPKWGFGMAPISSRMEARYTSAANEILHVLVGCIDLAEVDLDAISEVKGMFNRCVRQDQWDWFSVYTRMGRPPFPQVRSIARDLDFFRKSLSQGNNEAARSNLIRLKDNNLHTLLTSYISKPPDIKSSPTSGWVYILSTREQPSYLKIGMTHRSVEERVKEINSATGVLFPYSVRAVFQVKDAVLAEKVVFGGLASFRVRRDREFFEIGFWEAARIARQVLQQGGLIYRSIGTIAWYDEKKGYGFITRENGGDIFLHYSQVSKLNVSRLKEGTTVEFDIEVREKGLAAINAKPLED